MPTRPCRSAPPRETRRSRCSDTRRATCFWRLPACPTRPRHYRQALRHHPKSSEVPAADVAQVDTYRQQFEGFYLAASSHNASADTTLQRSLKLSLFPAAGVLAGASGTATLTLETAPAADMTVQLAAPNGSAQLP